MPIVEVETDVAQPLFTRRVAKAATLWAIRHGIPANHVLVKFHAMAASQIFSAGYPLDHVPGQPGARHFAFVSCTVAPDRSPEFCRALAATLAASMQPEVAPERLIVTFRTLQRDDVLLGSELTRAPSEVIHAETRP